MGAGIMNTLAATEGRPGMDLLSRYAECMVWLARYLERIENLARLIDVTETFVRTGNSANAWQSIIDINADRTRFAAFSPLVSAETVIAFYVTARDNPNSIVSLAHAARENARSVRPMISTEMWTHLNMFTNFLRGLTAEQAHYSRIAALCARIKQECQTQAGITEGTLYRDQAWQFYMIGRAIERADQITRLIDIKYHALLPPEAQIGSAVDASQWTAVLRSAAGYHAFRRLLARDLTPATVSGFLLKNEGFPRSLATALRQLSASLTALRTDYNLRHAAHITERVEQVRAILIGQTIEQIIIRGLHEFMDWVQVELQAIQVEVGNSFWPDLTPESAFSGQQQSQA